MNRRPGLDPLMIEAFSETMHELASAGKTTVLLSSHVLSEVERICSRIGLVRRGRLVSVQTLAALRETTPRRLTIWFREPFETEIALPSGWSVVSRDPMCWIVDVRGAIGPFLPVLSTLPVRDVAIASFTLEDAVLHAFAEPQV